MSTKKQTVRPLATESEKTISDSPTNDNGQILDQTIEKTQQGPKVRTLDDLADSRVLSCYTSLDTSSDLGKEQFARFSQSADRPVQDCIGKWFPVEHVIIQSCELTNRETGEIENSPRTVFIGHDGSTVDCWSNGVVRGLQVIHSLIGEPPYPAGFEMRVVEKRRGKNVKYVVEYRLPTTTVETPPTELPT